MEQIEKKIAVPLKYLSNFWRSLEMPLINCKIKFSLKWYEKCILSSSGTAATFTVANIKHYVLVVTLKTEDNTKSSKLLSKGFKRPIYWNEYKIIFKNYNENEYIRARLDASFQGVNKLFVLADAIGDNDGDNVTNPSNPTGRIYTSQQICYGAQGTYIYVTMMISGSRVNPVSPSVVIILP